MFGSTRPRETRHIFGCALKAKGNELYINIGNEFNFTFSKIAGLLKIKEQPDEVVAAETLIYSSFS